MATIHIADDRDIKEIFHQFRLYPCICSFVGYNLY
jgi:hypothetical protein